MFDGDLTKLGTFESTIHKSPLLPSTKKFSYLKFLFTCKSSAAEAVSGLAVTAANYKDAVKILKKQYGNKQLIISRHMNVLMNLESVSSYNDTQQMRHLFDVGIKACTHTPVSTFFVVIILRKPPGENIWCVQQKKIYPSQKVKCVVSFTVRYRYG